MQHIGSVYDGVGGLELCPSAVQSLTLIQDLEAVMGPLSAVRAMVSKDKEVVQFPRLFDMKGAVENWSNQLIRFMQETLTEVLGASMTATAAWDLDKPREEWVSTVPA